ncbi:hypothetical protein FACS1894158_04830 [Betaproteobacteria bacterium]|nr:hypothetical protein FACS1894158_04830 [Betaproteobacteria bacterium]
MRAARAPRFETRPYSTHMRPEIALYSHHSVILAKARLRGNDGDFPHVTASRHGVDPSQETPSK